MPEHSLSPADRLSNGVRNLLNSYLGLSAGQSLLVFASESVFAEPGSEAFFPLLQQECEQSGIAVQMFPLDEHTPFCPTLVKDWDVVLYVSRTMSIHKLELLDFLRTRTEARPCFYRLFDLSPEVLELCFGMTRQALCQLNSQVLTAARHASKICVSSASGTNLEIQVDPEAEWTSSFGFFDGRYPGVLPPGEVNSCSRFVSGTLVADGAINTSFPFSQDPRLQGKQIRLQLDQGRVVGASCADNFLTQVLNLFFSVENSDRVGEIGFGTNESIQRFVPFRSHINERFPGFHLGLGTPTQRKGNIDWSCPLHLDLILQDCQIYFDQTCVFSGGQWLRSALDNGNAPARADLYIDAL